MQFFQTMENWSSLSCDTINEPYSVGPLGTDSFKPGWNRFVWEREKTRDNWQCQKYQSKRWYHSVPSLLCDKPHVASSLLDIHSIMLLASSMSISAYNSSGCEWRPPDT